jgi:hypothetical protein
MIYQAPRVGLTRPRALSMVRVLILLVIQQDADANPAGQIFTILRIIK